MNFPYQFGQRIKLRLKTGVEHKCAFLHADSDHDLIVVGLDESEHQGLFNTVAFNVTTIDRIEADNEG